MDTIGHYRNKQNGNTQRQDDIDGRPRLLRAYWYWLFARCPTETMELFLSSISAWWAFSLINVYAIDKSTQLPPTLILLMSVAPLGGWMVFMFVTAALKVVGVLFRIESLRLIGLLGSVSAWSTISGLNARAFPNSPNWGAFAILALFSAWIFIRHILVLGEPISEQLRKDRQKRSHAGRT